MRRVHKSNFLCLLYSIRWSKMMMVPYSEKEQREGGRCRIILARLSLTRSDSSQRGPLLGDHCRLFKQRQTIRKKRST